MWTWPSTTAVSGQSLSASAAMSCDVQRRTFQGPGAANWSRRSSSKPMSRVTISPGRSWSCVSNRPPSKIVLTFLRSPRMPTPVPIADWLRNASKECTSRPSAALAKW